MTLCGRIQREHRPGDRPGDRRPIVGGFVDYTFPHIRAGFPACPINELVSVQPVTTPSGVLFYLRYTAGGWYVPQPLPRWACVIAALASAAAALLVAL